MMPDFSKGGYYSKKHSRAHITLFVALLLAGASAISLPFLVRDLSGLALVYAGYILAALVGRRWETKTALSVAVILAASDLALLSSRVANGLSLQLAVASSAVALMALSVGFGAAGRIARDHNQVKFSDQLPEAVDRAKFLTLLEKELARAKHRQLPSSLAIIEIRSLDKLGKAYGRHQRELILEQIRQALVRRLRKKDTLAWLGGPYFALLLPKTDRKRAETPLIQLKDALQSIPAQSVLRSGIDVSDWRTVVIELSGDEGDPNTALRKVATMVSPMVPQRIGLAGEEPVIAL